MRRIIAVPDCAGRFGIGCGNRLLSWWRPCQVTPRRGERRRRGRRRRTREPDPLRSEGMLEINHLYKKFGPLVAVDDVSFTVARGEVLGFLGPNGAGKSTTMKMATGFLAPDAGTAIVCGHDIRQAPLAAKRNFGYLPEGAPA